MTEDSCRSCGEPIVWARTLHGRMMPLDAEPDALKGNMILASSGEVGIAIQLSGLTPEARKSARKVGVNLYLSHFTSCPHAGVWRNRTKGER